MADIADVKKNGLWVTRLSVGATRSYTKSGRVWLNMIQRCTLGSAAQNRQPSYIGCEASAMFKDFQSFVEWHCDQIGYDQDSYELDKDILVIDNKLYSEDTCVLVPSALNNFFVANNVRRGEYPIGVSYHKHTDKFQAQIRIECKKIYLGIYNSPQEAHAIYTLAKIAEIERWILRLTNGEYKVDKRVVEALKIWQVRS